MCPAGQPQVASAEIRMTDRLDLFLIGWLFVLLIGSWVLVNALIDVSSNRVRRWFSDWWTAQGATVQRFTQRNRIGR
jgi:hypothetical protein